MEDREFFDLLYAHWAKTTGAEDRFWMSEQDESFPDSWNLLAVDQQQEKKLLGSFHSEADADFIAAVHGCVADMIRRLHIALDEADRLDAEKDDLVFRVAELEMDADGLHEVIKSDERSITELEAELSDERGFSAYLSCDLREALAETDTANAEVSKLKDRLENERANVEYWRSR